MKELFIGILSGTSLDAIDIALVEFDINNSNQQNNINLLETKNYSLDDDFKNKCREIINSNTCNLDDLGQLDHLAGLLFADAINDFLKVHNIDKKNIKAIGSHGQTIRHKPNLKYPFSLQIGDPNVIAFNTGIPVIADFRRKDIAAGGQGAPLAPFFHNNIFRDENTDRVIVNIGGISNITILPKEKDKKVRGYDIGPGNCLIDYCAKTFFNIPYDKDGNIAKSGTIINSLLEDMLGDPFFKETPPKSTGNDYFNINWINNHLLKNGFNFNNANNFNSEKKAELECKKIELDPAVKPRFDEEGLSKFLNMELDPGYFSSKNSGMTLYSSSGMTLNNILTTITHLTAQSIVNEINSLDLNKPDIYICGGGAYNKFLMELIKKISNLKTYSTSKIGIEPNWVEACLFAWLAKSRLYKEIDNFSETIYITGAKHNVCLGGIYT